jgi:hypothetical protein
MTDGLHAPETPVPSPAPIWDCQECEWSGPSRELVSRRLATKAFPDGCTVHCPKCNSQDLRLR